MDYHENSMTEKRFDTAPGAVASMVCGIVGLVLSCLPAVGLVLGIMALVLYSKAIKKISESGNTLDGKGMSVAGLVLGILSIVWGCFYLLYWIVAGSIFSGLLYAIMKGTGKI